MPDIPNEQLKTIIDMLAFFQRTMAQMAGDIRAIREAIEQERTSQDEPLMPPKPQ